MRALATLQQLRRVLQSALAELASNLYISWLLAAPVPFSLFSINQVLSTVSEISCRHLFAESLDIQSVARRGNAQRKQMSVDEDIDLSRGIGVLAYPGFSTHPVRYEELALDSPHAARPRRTRAKPQLAALCSDLVAKRP